jgi:hypothetical protein
VEKLYPIPEMPGLSIVILILLSMIFLYLARTPMHEALKILIEGTAGGFKKVAEWAANLSTAMTDNNRKVLLESGIADAEQKIMEEFRRLEATYSKHLADYPKIHLKLDDNVTRIDLDYKECGQVVPAAPGWSEVIESIARVKENTGDRIIEKMLTEIHKSAVEGEKKALAELRSESAKRHKILSALAPVWKQVVKLMDSVNKKVNLVIETTSRIDKYMEQYEKVREGGKDSIEMLSSRATKLFIFSLIVIAVAIFGAFINFQLIALPMAEMVPSGTRLAGIPVSEVSAMVIVALELVIGIFLLEAIGITNIFPQIAGMTRNKRLILLYGSLFGLFFLASVEASLAILREALAEAKTNVDIALAGDAGTAISSQGSHIAVIGQATLGFTLPWILAMVAVPLEMFIEASQHVFSKFLTLLVRLFGHIAGIFSYIFEYIFKILIHLYDAYIIIPLQIAAMVTKKQGA